MKVSHIAVLALSVFFSAGNLSLAHAGDGIIYDSATSHRNPDEYRCDPRRENCGSNTTVIINNYNGRDRQEVYSFENDYVYPPGRRPGERRAPYADSYAPGVGTGFRPIDPSRYHQPGVSDLRKR